MTTVRTLIAATAIIVVGAGCTTNGTHPTAGPLKPGGQAAPPMADHSHTACELVDSFNRGEFTNTDPGAIDRLRARCANEAGTWT